MYPHPASRRLVAALAAGILLTLGAAVPLAVQAQTGPTGREIAEGAETRCVDKVEVRNVFDPSRQYVLGRWVNIAGPTFGKSPGQPRDAIAAHAVDPRHPLRQYVSDGRSIERTLDGGCTWKQVHSLTASTLELGLNGTGLVDRVLQLGVAERGPAPARVWALVAPLQETVGAIRVFVSDDGGNEWEERSSGLPQLHTRTDTTVVGATGTNHPSAVLALAPSDADTAYIGLSSTVEGDGPVFATADGGRTWARRMIVDLQLGAQHHITEMAVDPGDAASVWMLGADGATVMHSSDRAVSWRFVSLGPAGNAVRADGLHVSRSGGSPHVQVVGTSGSDGLSALYRSIDGVNFVPRVLSEPVRGDAAVSQGGDPDALVMSTDRPDQALHLASLPPNGLMFLNIAVPGLGDVNAPQGDRTSDPVHWFRRFDGLAAFVMGPPPGEPPPPPKVLPDRLFDAAKGVTGRGGRVPGDLSPNPLELALPDEGRRDVDYVLDLPPLPTPVDVWFLMDTSGSMGGAIEGLQLGIDRIIEELKAAGLDAWFGLAEYKGENYRYERLADIAPPGDAFEKGLRRLYASGGGEETQYTALYQTVTGEGQKDVGIDPNQGASFRPEALKIIVHASDEPFGQVPDGPTADEAAIAMSQLGVYHVGLDLSVGSRGVSTEPRTRTVKADMDEMARATGTFAPIEGVDCNGDGEYDLRAGEPLTCSIVRDKDDVELSPAIISAVRAVRDETAVALTVEDAAGLEVVIDEPLRVPVNVKVANQLPFSVSFTCPSGMSGDVAEVKLLALVRGAPSAQATAKVACGTPPPPPPAVPRPPAPIVPFIATPPQLVPELEPALSPINQSSPAQVASPSAQPGLAAQPGEVATAKQRVGRPGPPEPPREGSVRGDGDERRGLPGGAAGTLGAGAAMAVAFGGWSVAQSRSRRPARQRA